MIPIWPTIKTKALKLLAKLTPKIGKAFKRSLLGENKGVVVRYRYETSNRNILCLVHGFTGTAAGTFFKFPDIAIADPSLNGWDLVSIGFASDNLPNIPLHVWAQLPNITQVAEYMVTTVTNLLSRYDRIAFLAHSMGGLVVQKAILDLQPADRRRISHLLLFGTPSAGLHKATILRWYNRQIADMDKDGTFIRELRAAWAASYPNGPDFSFITVAGELDDFVPEESSLDPFAEKYHARTTGNHIDMVKPTDIVHPSYQILQHALTRQPPFLKIYKTEELNNLIGNYAGIINALNDKLTQIDTKAFREYIFALEGYRDVDAAILELEKSPLVKDNTDFIGILGGRYKRRYLAELLVADKLKAIEFYQEAYGIATTRNDTDQIYYHAINLAFLYLYGNSDKMKMREFAQIAQTAALASNSTGYWCDATLAEASLYLDNWPDAIANYQKAIEKATGDLRALSSMYLNARNACFALDRPDWAKVIEDLLIRRLPPAPII